MSLRFHDPVWAHGVAGASVSGASVHPAVGIEALKPLALDLTQPSQTSRLMTLADRNIILVSRDLNP